MSSADYTATPSLGKLKLKGVKVSKITKKKNKPTKDEKPGEEDEDNSIMLRKLVDEDREMESEETRMKQARANSPAKDGDADGYLEARTKTTAERKYDEQRRKRVRLYQATSTFSADLAQPTRLFSLYRCLSWRYWEPGLLTKVYAYS